MADPAPQAPSQQRSGARWAAAIGAAVMVAAPFTAPREGLRTHPYWDAGHVRSVCYGETERKMRTYTAAECLALLRERERVDYAPAVARCVPGFIDPTRRYAFAASIDAAYNGGIGGFCRSRMARAFNAGQWRRGCDLFLGWRATAKGRVLAGLERRRQAERTLCLTPAPPAAPTPKPTLADYQMCTIVRPGPMPRRATPILYPHNSELT